MAQALLDVHPSREDRNLLEEEKLLTVQWSGEAVDTRYVNEATERHVKHTLSQLAISGRCPVVGCLFASRTSSRQLHHVESHEILYSTTMHAHTRHREDRDPVVQVNTANWNAGR